MRCRWAAITIPVAPREGAWIETVISFKSVPASIVAPREGAWIETAINLQHYIITFVAPREGAWIETWYANS